MILAVDLGNYNIKTSEGVIFESRYQEVEKEDFDNELLEIENKFYKMEYGEFENEFNKAKKNYLPNLLYAISKSIDENEIEVDLVLGVPASNLGITSEIKNDIEDKNFKFKVFGQEKKVKINRVATVAEGLSSFYTLKKEERLKDLIILDIGGRTFNVCAFSKGKTLLKFTQPGGMLDLYSMVQENYNKFGNNANIEEIVRLIENGTINCEEEKVRFVKEQINKIKLKISNLNTFKIFVTGGGSLELQQGLRTVLGEINYIPDTIFSNVKGNKMIAELKWGKENE
ncbi:ParM/StbA family protein [Clostridium sp. DSM 100503]|uniref:ParM/StbA family protein n=1 Tax=Clostridium sp. DSM 100503 TaxID=2963282 RepID=UPI00214A2B4D|nr:ParM/StbA family protein [Clostridium sp. DSM 100503]MCR1952737.1 ParM/StbA family protein [Clostridium sp. DSM 100503]